MIPFNLEQYQSGVNALTRDGCVSSYLATCESCCGHGKLISHVEGSEYPLLTTLEGNYHNDNYTYHHDLVSMQSPYSHLSEGDLVMVWIGADPDVHALSAVLRKFKCENDEGLAGIMLLDNDFILYRNCLSLDEYAKQYL